LPKIADNWDKKSTPRSRCFDPNFLRFSAIF
jgi:hypothetical protein